MAKAYKYKEAFVCLDCGNDGLFRGIVDDPNSIVEVEIETEVCSDCGESIK